MEFMLRFLIKNAWKFGENYDRLQAFSQAQAAKGEDLIPLEPYPNWTEGVLQALLGIDLLILLVAGWISFGDTGLSFTTLLILGGFGLPAALLLVILFNTDSRYVLDMKNKRVIYVFTFFTRRSVTLVSTFTNVKSIELDSKEINKTGLGSWVYWLSVVKKTFERVPITRSVYSSDSLAQIGQLIAGAIQCPYKTGERKEKFRIMGL